MTDEIAAMEADDDGKFARLDRLWDKDVGGDDMVVDGLVRDVVNVERVEFLFDGCDRGRIHAAVWQKKEQIKIIIKEKEK